MRKRIERICLAVLVLALITGCGSGNNGTSSETEPSVETEPEPSVEPDQGPSQGPSIELERMDAEGRHEFQITTEDGKEVGVQLSPQGVPDDFPLPYDPEWTVLTAGKLDIGGGVRWNAAFQFEEDIEGLTNRYAEELRSLGYEIELSELASDMFGIEISGTLDGKPVDGIISIGRAGEMHVININFGHPMDD